MRVRKHGGIKADILAAIAANPKAKNVEIAEIVGASAGYVSVTKQRAGLAKKHSHPVRFLPENEKWILRQCEAHNLDVQDWVNACITDARLDEELGAK